MPILDDRGRLFGKVNLIDAAALLFVLVLVPLGYASWMLFRLPPPVIDSITPSVVRPGEPDQRIVMRGHDLRPFLRVFIGETPATFLFQSPVAAEVKLPSLGPGTYTVSLFDQAAEIIRRENSLTVAPEPVPVMVAPPVVETITPRVLEFMREVQVVELRGKHFGVSTRAFVGPREATWHFYSPEWAEIEVFWRAGGSYDLVLLDATKEVARYEKAITFQPIEIGDLELQVRFVVRPEVLAFVKQHQGERASASVAGQTSVPVLVSYELLEERVGTTKPDLPSLLDIVKGVVRLTALKTQNSWQVNGQVIRAGAPFSLFTPDYVLTGDILSLSVLSTRAR